MNANLSYWLVGYDRETERQAVSYEIPTQFVSELKRVARVAPQDRYALGDYPLNNSQARDIAGMIGETIDVSRFEFFFEPHVVTPKVSARRA